jgi:cell fate regulator YaaT (PSP1 superfamily)
MNNKPDSTNNQVTAPVVTFSNIPLDDEPPTGVAFDSIPEEELPKELTVVGVQFKKGGKVYSFDPGKLTIQTGDEVIIDTARGAEYGFCTQGNYLVPAEQVVQPLRPVIRVATETDKRTRQEFQSKEPAAFTLCQQKIADHGLEMKLVSAEYSFDGSKILFYFTADGRVDFRELVKDLASVFRTRIELRQIGVRDEAKMMGGLGICGRPFCCKQFLDDFQPVSIKMAKTQNLSLNPTKISGTCGRLMCCLKYEQEAYESLLKTSPKQDSLVNTCDGKGTVVDSSLLKQTVKVRLESDPSSVKCYNNCDICVLRNGKGRKTDPPIPDDLPPLPKPQEEPQEQETITMFDESVLAEPPVQEQPKNDAVKNDQRKRRSDKDRKNNRRPEGRRRSQETGKPQETQRSPKPQRAQESGKPQENGGAGKPRRRYYRGKKKPQGGNSQ